MNVILNSAESTSDLYMKFAFPVKVPEASVFKIICRELDFDDSANLWSSLLIQNYLISSQLVFSNTEAIQANELIEIYVDDIAGNSIMDNTLHFAISVEWENIMIIDDTAGNEYTHSSHSYPVYDSDDGKGLIYFAKDQGICSFSSHELSFSPHADIRSDHVFAIHFVKDYDPYLGQTWTNAGKTEYFIQCSSSDFENISCSVDH